MKTRYAFMKTVSAAGLAGLLAGVFAARAADPVNGYYFGNSLTGCSDPKWHEELGRSAGREWKSWAFLGAGWQLWQHRHALQHSGVDMKRDSRGDLTIDPGQIQQSTGFNTRQFYTMKWDAIVLQPFSMGLTWKCQEMWGTKFDQETDVGDIASAIGMIDIYLSLNPQGRVLIYQDWPAMEAGQIPPEDQLPDWAKKMKAASGKLRTAEFPDRAAFDYEKSWARDKYEPSSDPEKFWLRKNARSKDYHDRVFAALKEHYPELWKSGRLRVIPVGDIFLALHRKMKAGEFPGCADVSEFYTDVQHIRGGLPRYTVAAAFYAGLFRECPDKLDWKLYNSLERYREAEKGADDPYHDRGELLEITPERARIVNDIIWEVTNSHPDAKPGS
jgi:hypothetical protein